MSPDAVNDPVKQNPEEYELVRRDQLEQLQHEVEKVKRNPFGDTANSKDLLTAMDHLNKNVSKLVRIFETANDEIVRDYKDKANTEKINKVLEQNEKLAKGIVAIADLLKEVKSQKPESSFDSTDSFDATPGQPQNQQGQMDAPPQWHDPNAPQNFAPQQGFPTPSGFGQPQSGFGQPQSGFGQPQQGRRQPGQRPPMDLSDVPPPPPR